jgi:hypothetical protein
MRNHLIIIEMEKMRPKYTLGKLKNKYLIMEIAAFALYDFEAFYLTYSSSRMLRGLLLDNLSIFKNVVSKEK